MHKIDTPNAVNGLYQNRDEYLRTPGTIIDASIFQALQDEIIAVIEAAGFELKKGNNFQLQQAISKFIQDLIKGHEHTEEEKLVLNLPEEFIEVNLTKGYTTFISKEDLEILNQAWHVSINKGSLNATSSIKTDKGVRKVMMHRVIEEVL